MIRFGIIKDLRTKQHLSQTELGERAGVSLHSIFRLEKGTREPKMDELIRIAKALGVAVDVLISEDKDDDAVPQSADITGNGNIVGNGNSVSQTITTQYEPYPRLPGVKSEAAPGDLGKAGSEYGTDRVLSMIGNQHHSISVITREDVTMIPVISADGSFNSGAQFSLPLEEIPLMGSDVDVSSLFAAKIDDDMMVPYLSSGDFAVCQLSQDVRQGQLVVLTMGGSCCIRGIRRDAAGDIYALVTGNKMYPNTDIDGNNRSQLKIVGRVLRIYHASTAPGILM